MSREREKKGVFIDQKMGDCLVRQEQISSLNVEIPFVSFLRGCGGASCCTGLNSRTDRGEQWKWKQWKGTG